MDVLVTMSVLGSPNSCRYHRISRLLQLKHQTSGSKTVGGFSIILILKGVLEGGTLCFSSYRNRKSKVKLRSVGVRERKKDDIFCTVYFVRRQFLWDLCFISKYCVLNTLSEYTYFTYQKTLLHTFLLLVSKIVGSLQRTLNFLLSIYMRIFMLTF